jgi:hypothetical protein
VHFCVVCRTHVLGYDHHCQILGACVGRGTFATFLLFMCSVALLCVAGLPWITIRTFMCTSNIGDKATLFVLWLIGLPMMLVSGKLSIHHIMAVWAGTYSRERRFQLFKIIPSGHFVPMNSEKKLSGVRNFVSVLKPFCRLQRAPALNQQLMITEPLEFDK